MMNQNNRKNRKLLCVPCAALLLLASCAQQDSNVSVPATGDTASISEASSAGGDAQAESGAASDSVPASATGTDTSFSEFIGIDIRCAPSGAWAMPDGSLLVTDTFSKCLWRVQEKESTVYAGDETVPGLYGEPVGGYRDGDLSSSYFSRLWDVAPFLDGWAVSDMDNNAIRIVRENGVKTLGIRSENANAGIPDITLERPSGLAADSEGNLYVADTGNGIVYKVTPEGIASKVADGLADPTGLCCQGGALYIAEAGANRIVKIEGGKPVTVAGSGEEGLTDGPAQEAAFSAPSDIAVGDDGVIYVADTSNSAIRRIRDGQVDTVFLRDVSKADLGLVYPSGLLLQEGRLYICDNFSRKLYVMDWD